MTAPSTVGRETVGDDVPDLEFAYPDCTVCEDGGEVSYDAGYYCLKCGTCWDSDGRKGQTDA